MSTTKRTNQRLLPNIGIITLEDAETGEQLEINTADRRTRSLFNELVSGRETELSHTLRRNNIDAITAANGEGLPPGAPLVLSSNANAG